MFFDSLIVHSFNNYFCIWKISLLMYLPLVICKNPIYLKYSIVFVECVLVGFPRWHWVVKNYPANLGDSKRHKFVTWIRKIPWRRAWHGKNSHPCLENPMDRGACRATVHRIAKSRIWLKWLRMHTCNLYLLINMECFGPLWWLRK